MKILVVDAANVIGSVPDGWWTDRAGAATRLHDALVASPGAYDSVLLVLEGRARAGVPEQTIGTVRTIHAPGSGDDEIVRVIEEHPTAEITLASADRGLLARVPQVQALGPRSVRRGVPPISRPSDS